MDLKGHLKTAASLLKELQAAPALENVDTLPSGTPALQAFLGAKALVFLKDIKGGFWFSGKLCTGFIIVKRADGQLKLGGEAALTLGPLGRTSSVAAHLGLDSDLLPGFAGSFAYSRSQGLYGGIAFDGMVLAANPADNEAIYGTSPSLSVHDILYKAPRPAAADDLFEALAELEKLDEQRKEAQIRQGIAVTVVQGIGDGAKGAWEATSAAAAPALQGIGDGAKGAWEVASAAAAPALQGVGDGARGAWEATSAAAAPALQSIGDGAKGAWEATSAAAAPALQGEERRDVGT